MTALARIALAAALLCAAAWATPAAAAAPMTGGELYNNCSSENAVDRTECLAFLGGVWTGAMIYGSRAKELARQAAG